MSDSITVTAGYSELVGSIKPTLADGYLRAGRAVNSILVEMYWEIGREIVARQQEQGWDARVIESLSAELRAANPAAHGLSVRNLRYMTALACRWPAGIVQQQAAQLPWGHIIVILDSCPNRETSEFYSKRAVEEGWTRDVLQSMISSRLHERTQLAGAPAGAALALHQSAEVTGVGDPAVAGEFPLREVALPVQRLRLPAHDGDLRIYIGPPHRHPRVGLP